MQTIDKKRYAHFFGLLLSSFFRPLFVIIYRGQPILSSSRFILFHLTISYSIIDFYFSFSSRSITQNLLRWRRIQRQAKKKISSPRKRFSVSKCIFIVCLGHDCNGRFCCCCFRFIFLCSFLLYSNRDWRAQQKMRKTCMKHARAWLSLMYRSRLFFVNWSSNFSKTKEEKTLLLRLFKSFYLLRCVFRGSSASIFVFLGFVGLLNARVVCSYGSLCSIRN